MRCDDGYDPCALRLSQGVGLFAVYGNPRVRVGGLTRKKPERHFPFSIHAVESRPAFRLGRGIRRPPGLTWMRW